jgi:hypothetical protein
MHRYELSLGAMKPSTRGDWVMYEDVEAEIEKARQEDRSEMLAAERSGNPPKPKPLVKLEPRDWGTQEFAETINALVDAVNELREKHG